MPFFLLILISNTYLVAFSSRMKRMIRTRFSFMHELPRSSPNKKKEVEGVARNQKDNRKEVDNHASDTTLPSKRFGNRD